MKPKTWMTINIVLAVLLSYYVWWGIGRHDYSGAAIDVILVALNINSAVRNYRRIEK